MFKVMNTEKILFFILAVIAYICAEYLWISKILITELDFIIKNIEDKNILYEAEHFKSCVSLGPKYLMSLFKFINGLEKTYGTDLSNILKDC